MREYEAGARNGARYHNTLPARCRGGMLSLASNITMNVHIRHRLLRMNQRAALTAVATRRCRIQGACASRGALCRAFMRWHIRYHARMVYRIILRC